MRRGFGILGMVLTLIVIAVVGFFAYQVGYSDGFAQHVPQGTTAPLAPYPYYYYGGLGFFHFGWIFGLLFFLFFVFVFFRIIAFGLWGGPRRWGYYGRGWGYMGGGHGGGDIPPAIDERMKEWHRQAHGEPATPTPASPPPPPVPDK